MTDQTRQLVIFVETDAGRFDVTDSAATRLAYDLIPSMDSDGSFALGEASGAITAHWGTTRVGPLTADEWVSLLADDPDGEGSFFQCCDGTRQAQEHLSAFLTSGCPDYSHTTTRESLEQMHASHPGTWEQDPRIVKIYRHVGGDPDNWGEWDPEKEAEAERWWNDKLAEGRTLTPAQIDEFEDPGFRWRWDAADGIWWIVNHPIEVRSGPINLDWQRAFVDNFTFGQTWPTGASADMCTAALRHAVNVGAVYWYHQHGRTVFSTTDDTQQVMTDEILRLIAEQAP